MPSLILAQAATSQSPFVSFLPIVAMLAIFYFILFVPQKRQMKQHQELISSLQKGDQVVTAGGLIGDVVAIKGDQVTLRTGTSTVVVEKARIQRKATAPADAK
ncbi:MAG TPA: preprotein translocase subunit YajC [Longimicrobium sp.]|jgi:preprotein translocase subunit YajC